MKGRENELPFSTGKVTMIGWSYLIHTRSPELLIPEGSGELKFSLYFISLLSFVLFKTPRQIFFHWILFSKRSSWRDSFQTQVRLCHSSAPNSPATPVSIRVQVKGLTRPYPVCSRFPRTSERPLISCPLLQPLWPHHL